MAVYKSSSDGGVDWLCCTNRLNADEDLELGDLALEVARHEGLAEQLDAVHLGLDAAPAVVTASVVAARDARSF